MVNEFETLLDATYGTKKIQQCELTVFKISTLLCVRNQLETWITRNLINYANGPKIIHFVSLWSIMY